MKSIRPPSARARHPLAAAFLAAIASAINAGARFAPQTRPRERAAAERRAPVLGAKHARGCRTRYTHVLSFASLSPAIGDRAVRKARARRAA